MHLLICLPLTKEVGCQGWIHVSVCSSISRCLSALCLKTHQVGGCLSIWAQESWYREYCSFQQGPLLLVWARSIMDSFGKVSDMFSSCSRNPDFGMPKSKLTLGCWTSRNLHLGLGCSTVSPWCVAAGIHRWLGRDLYLCPLLVQQVMQAVVIRVGWAKHHLEL